MNQTVVLSVAYVAYLLLIGGVYIRRRRWSGAVGWALLVGGALLAVGGAGDWFPWAGLLWTCVAAFGLLLIASDVVGNRE